MATNENVVQISLEQLCCQGNRSYFPGTRESVNSLCGDGADTHRDWHVYTVDRVDHVRSNQPGQVWLTVSHITVICIWWQLCLCSSCTCVKQTHTQVHTYSVRSVGEACMACLRCKLRQAETGLFMVPLTMCAQVYY